MQRFLIVVLGLLCAGCAPDLEIEKVIEVTDVRTGWYDAGILEDGKNKLVPSIALKLHNITGEPVQRVDIWGIFKRTGETENWGEHFVRGIGPDGLAGGATGGEIVLRSTFGYTGEEARTKMLQHSGFIDAKVEVFAKHGSRTWVKVGDYPIKRELLTE
jgi:hypothetical protein